MQFALKVGQWFHIEWGGWWFGGPQLRVPLLGELTVIRPADHLPPLWDTRLVMNGDGSWEWAFRLGRTEVYYRSWWQFLRGSRVEKQRQEQREREWEAEAT